MANPTKAARKALAYAVSTSGTSARTAQEVAAQCSVQTTGTQQQVKQRTIGAPR